MTDLVPIVVVLFVASITPGPNNLIVTSLASTGGVAAALPAVAGVVMGSLMLLLLCSLGMANLAAASPGVANALSLVAALYLAWLGIGLFRAANSQSDGNRSLPRTVPTVAMFQFANPKAWLLVAAVSAMAGKSSRHGIGLPLLVLILPLITTACLLCWAMMGAGISKWLEQPSSRTAFNRLMGVLLIASAPMVFL